ncbi:hypothetical protein KIW84_056421 [Lathyrus oleraceus]|uniref:Uncharacterized protein n=1 Tax=Pisum sativum TaxID=3888 RepID=A0A9D4X0I8_PEA|nr:hypothetical protein KIW84_056421 [Pisum sativum]
MWPEVQSDELLPPLYKKGPDRPRKLRIRECDEDDSKSRFPSIYYRCTKCDKFRHNIQSCKSKKQDLNALKRKKKVKADAGNVNQSGGKVGTKTESDINTTNPAMQTETDINTTSAKKKGKAKFKQEGKAMRKRSKDEGGIMTQEGNGSQNEKEITKKSPKKKSKYVIL